MQIRGQEEREEQSLADQSTCPGGGIAEAPESQGKHSSGWLENVLAQCPPYNRLFLSRLPLPFLPSLWNLFAVLSSSRDYYAVL